VTTFVNDTSIIGVGESVEVATDKIKRIADKINKETRKCSIKLNEAKSIHVDFTNKLCQYIPSTINDKVILHSNKTK